jgi:hypothetical protein
VLVVRGEPGVGKTALLDQWPAIWPPSTCTISPVT